MDFKGLTPGAYKNYTTWKNSVFEDGALDRKHKELIALAVSHALLCEYCIEFHVEQARKAGATEAELAESIMVAALLGAGSTLTYSRHAKEHKKD